MNTTGENRKGKQMVRMSVAGLYCNIRIQHSTTAAAAADDDDDDDDI